jgi:hypothetical protein
LPGQITPGSTCQIAPKEMPVEAMDSIITQGIVSKAPTPTTTRIDHQGISVGHAVTAMIDMMKPNRKTIEYCPQNVELARRRHDKSREWAAERGEKEEKERKRGGFPYPPLRDLVIFSHHSGLAILEACVDGLALPSVNNHPDKSLLERTPILDKDRDDRKGIVHKGGTRHKKICHSVIGRPISLRLVDVDLVICREHGANVIRLHLIVKCRVGVNRHIRGPRHISIVHNEDDEAGDDAHNILLELSKERRVHGRRT